MKKAKSILIVLFILGLMCNGLYAQYYSQDNGKSESADLEIDVIHALELEPQDGYTEIHNIIAGTIRDFSMNHHQSYYIYGEPSRLITIEVSPDDGQNVKLAMTALGCPSDGTQQPLWVNGVSQGPFTLSNLQLGSTPDAKKGHVYKLTFKWTRIDASDATTEDSPYYLVHLLNIYYSDI